MWVVFTGVLLRAGGAFFDDATGLAFFLAALVFPVAGLLLDFAEVLDVFVDFVAIITVLAWQDYSIKQLYSTAQSGSWLFAVQLKPST